jgi:hypothetical protein
MIAQDPFTQRYASLLDESYDVVGRIVLNAYFSLGSSPGGFITWWRNLHGTTGAPQKSCMSGCIARACWLCRQSPSTQMLVRASVQRFPSLHAPPSNAHAAKCNFLVVHPSTATAWWMSTTSSSSWQRGASVAILTIARPTSTVTVWSISMTCSSCSQTGDDHSLSVPNSMSTMPVFVIAEAGLAFSR